VDHVLLPNAHVDKINEFLINTDSFMN